MAELKPCPFCGKKPSRSKETVHGREYYIVRCDNLKCLIKPTTDYYANKGSDVKAWNKRVGIDDIYSKNTLGCAIHFKEFEDADCIFSPELFIRVDLEKEA